MTDEQIKLGIAGCLRAVKKEDAIFLFFKGVIADKDAELATFRQRITTLEQWAQTAYATILFSSRLGKWDASGLLNSAPDGVRPKEEN